MTTLLDIRVRPLGIKAEATITPDQLAMLQRLDDADFPYVREKLLAHGKIPDHEVDEAIFEFKRYMALAALSDKTLGMVSPLVDEVWHQFILFTRHYTKFCQEVFGYYVHHLPATSYTPLTPGAGRNLVSEYEAYFGPVTRLWASGSDDCSASTGDNNCSVGQCDGSKDD